MIIQDVVTWIYDLLINVCNISCFACKFFAALFCTLLFSCMLAINHNLMQYMPW